MTVEAVLERRLQTQLVRKGFAVSMEQARQFIVHRHITAGSKVITSPSYLVSKEEEGKIGFLARSRLNDAEHPERAIKNEKTARAKGKQN